MLDASPPQCVRVHRSPASVQRLWYTGLAVDAQVRQAIDVLRRGGIVAYPTDTVYGLGAHAYDDKAVARVFEVKGRPRHLALPLLLSSVAQIASVARDVPRVAWVLAERFLPGGLTLVLLKAPSIPSAVSGGSDTIAVRVPDHPVPTDIIDGLGAPITGTSANATGQPSPVTAQEVLQQLAGRVDFVIDGTCPGGRHSSVIDVTGETPRMLREGVIRREDIERACGITLS